MFWSLFVDLLPLGDMMQTKQLGDDGNANRLSYHYGVVHLQQLSSGE